MVSLGVSIYLFSMSWLFLVPVFTPASHGWIPLVLFGTGTACLALRDIELHKADRRWLIFLVPMVVTAVLIPFPYNLGSISLSAGILLAYFRPRLRSIGAGFIFSGIILSFQAALIPLYFLLASRFHKAGILAPLSNLLLEAVGSPSWVNDAILYVQTNVDLFSMATTWEKLGLFPLLGFLLSGMIVLMLSSARKRDFLFLTLLSIGYAILRYVFLVLLFTHNGRISLFWSPIAISVSFLPLALILYLFFPPLPGIRISPLEIGRNGRLFIGLVLSFMLLLSGMWGFHDPGKPKSGRILIDERHSDWEWTTIPYDTRWYGEKSGYNYYSLFQYLSLYYRVDRGFQDLTPTLLAGYDILVIKTPTEPFSPAEIESIERFVRQGGGLFLISDHTNVFGISTNINPIAKKFGLRFFSDSTYELSTGSLSEYLPPDIFPHPIVQRLPLFLFATSCTLEAPLSADEAMVGYGLKTVRADYSRKNFFPGSTETPDMEFGLFLQSAAVQYGQGRVAAFTDSTVFSNFWMFMPGKPELALGTLEWLNRKNTGSSLKPVFSISLLIIFFLLIYIASHLNRFYSLFIAVSIGSLALAASLPAYRWLNHINYPSPQPHTKAVRVSFEREHSHILLPVSWKEFTSDIPQRQFHTFFVWSQRLGYFPSLKSRLEDALAEGDITVIVNPVKHFSRDDRDKVINYVQQGGKVLLLDSASNQKSTGNELLMPFGMKIDYASRGKSLAVCGSDRKINTTPQAGRVTGGQPLCSTEQGEGLLSVVRQGKGKMVVFTDGDLFSNALLGDVSGIPNEYQKEISELEFWLLRKMVEN